MMNNSHDLKSIKQDHFAYQKQTPYVERRWNLFRYFPPTTLYLLMIMVCFCIGFVIFSEKTDQLQPQDPLPKADAIIVLTGGENRIKTGINLLKQGLGSRLLISGVNTTTNSDSLIYTNHIDYSLFTCCIDIGDKAINTKGNAEESTAWIRKYNYKTVYIVTHDYHMWRSLRELKYLMPDINFISYPVKNNDIENTIQQINRIRILASEYIKTIGVYIRTIF
ncbi:YdcF family protein [Bartonella sp. B30(2025)]